MRACVRVCVRACVCVCVCVYARARACQRQIYAGMQRLYVLADVLLHTNMKLKCASSGIKKANQGEGKGVNV